MPARRRSHRRGPLTEFAQRSPMHALGAWVFKSALIALMFLGVWLLIANWAVPSLVEGLRR